MWSTFNTKIDFVVEVDFEKTKKWTKPNTAYSCEIRTLSHDLIMNYVRLEGVGTPGAPPNWMCIVCTSKMLQVFSSIKVTTRTKYCCEFFFVKVIKSY